MKRNKVPPDSEGVCRKCQKKVVANIPFIQDGIIGKKSEDHGCGEAYVHYCFYLDLDAELLEDFDKKI